MELRPYQTEAVERIRAAFSRGRRAPLYEAPCGSGKTVMFAFVAKRASERGLRVVILVHRRELLLQASATLTEFEVPHGLVVAGKPTPQDPVVVASKDTLARRKDFPEPDLVVPDEAHHAVSKTFLALLSRWPLAKRLGVTATPGRLDGRGLDAAFDELIRGPSMASLITQGYLAPFRAFAPPTDLDLKGVRTIGGDFSKDQVVGRVDTRSITGDAVEHYRRLCPDARAVAFCVTVEHARHVSETFRAEGIPSECIDGSLSNDDRDAAVNRLRSGETMVLTSCELVSEGFDLPSVKAAILLRPTRSVTVHIQQCGRPLRPEPGKTAIIIDHVGNIQRLGLPDEERAWTLDGLVKREGTPGVSRCLECFACFEPGHRKCPACGATVKQKPKAPPPVHAGDLVEVTDRPVPENPTTLAEWHRVAKARGRKPGWAWVQWNLRKRKVVRA